jgi:hypothetical protein
LVFIEFANIPKIKLKEDIKKETRKEKNVEKRRH